MAKVNTKRIEELAVDELDRILWLSDYLEPHIEKNDRTLSWDGDIFFYNSSDHVVGNLLGKIPVQVKGTQQNIVSDATYSFGIDHLRNYYNDGGVMFFLVCLDDTFNRRKIYYASLTKYDLKGLLQAFGKQKTRSIKLEEFPADNLNEIATICRTFIENRKKQLVDLFGDELPTLEKLRASGHRVENLSCSGYTYGIEVKDFDRFISTHEMYLYAKLENLDAYVPIEKVADATVERYVCVSIKVGETEYYNSFKVVTRQGIRTFTIGKSFTLLSDEESDRESHKEKAFNICFNLNGTLQERIQDLEFFVASATEGAFSIGINRITINGLQEDAIERRKNQLRYFKDVQKMLNVLGVQEELRLEHITDDDETNIKNFVRSVLYHQPIGLNTKHKVSYGLFPLCNLKVLIWADRQNNNGYIISSYYDDHPIVMFEESDIEQKNPIPSTKFLLLDKNAFMNACNIKLDLIFEDIINVEYTNNYEGYVNLFLLEVLRAYDESVIVREDLLEFADKICEWIGTKALTPDAKTIWLLNKMQILKRRRPLEFEELKQIDELRKDDNPPEIRCAAYLLFGDNNAAQQCFDEISENFKHEFLEFPICRFGALQE